jgi:hypothetical protein
VSYDAGAAKASYILSIDQPRQAAAELRALFQGIQQQASSLARVPTSAASGGAKQFGPTSQDTAQVVAYANAQARLAQIQNTGRNALAGLTQAEQIYQQALSKLNTNSIEAIRLQSQLAAVQNRIANQVGGGLPVLPRTVENFGPDALKQIQSGLLGIVGPAALVSTGFQAITNTADSFKRAFEFKAELDQNKASITAQLIGIRDSGQAFEEARVFADRYKLTQEDTTTAIQASVPLLRQSKASLTDVLTVLAQLQVLKPEQGIQGAAFALAELQGGQSRSLATRFNIPIAAANELKKQIQQGGDAVQILGDYLDKAGIGAQALAVRTQGAAGALNDAKIAAEQLTIAQGTLAASKGGIALVEEQATVYRGLANVLNGDVVGGLKAQAATIAANAAGQQAYNQAIAAGKNETQAAALQQGVYDQVLRDGYISLGLFTPAQNQATEATNNHTRALGVSKDALNDDALKKLDDQIATAGLSAQQAQLTADSARAAQGLLGAGDQALILARKYGIAADQAKFLISQQQQLSNATALADQRAGERDPNSTLTAAQTNAFAKLTADRRKEDAADAKSAADKAAAEAKRVRSAQDALNLARASTKEQKIAELQRQQRATTDQAEKLQLQAQIEQEKRSGAGRVGAAQSTALQLQNTEENSQLQLLRTQREGLERLRDQQEDFDVRRVRSKEDEDRKIRGLLARGQIAEANRERENFARDQQRSQEDFDREKRRTLRNNQEGLGDIGARTDLRQSQIGARAALRGVSTGGGGLLGGSVPPASLSGAGGVSGGARIIQVNMPMVLTTPDGQTIATITYPFIQAKIDEDLAVELRGATPPGGSQTAVAGARP